MKIYGYCRISRKQQSIERQKRNILAAFPSAILVCEAYTGTSMNRTEWKKLIDKVQKGDIIVFDSVSRMSRNAEEGFEAYEDLFNKGVSLVFLKEPHINTDTFKKAKNNSIELTGTSIDCILEGINKYLLEIAKEQIKIAFDQAEKEVQDLRQRTKEGIETARLNGKRIGRTEGAKLTTKKSIKVKDIMRRHCKDFGGSLSDKEVMQ